MCSWTFQASTVCGFITSFTFATPYGPLRLLDPFIYDKCCKDAWFKNCVSVVSSFSDDHRDTLIFVNGYAVCDSLNSLCQWNSFPVTNRTHILP
jgi:hypothetical protein